MISQVMQGLSTVFTVDHLIYFVAGIAAAWIWQSAKASFRHKSVRIKWRPLVVGMSVLVLLYVTISTHKASQCVTEFNHVLGVRSAINDQDQAVSLEERKLIYDWIHTLVYPPPDIARMDPSDSRRQQWALNLTVQTDQQFAKSLQQQADNERARDENPLPNSTCS